MGDIAQYEFKGVTVVIATLLMFLLCQQPSGAGAIRAVQSAVTVPYCVFLNQSQELDCVCPDAAGEPDSNHVDSAPLNFPSEDYLVASGNSSVASIKLHSCQSVNLRLDLRPLARPFYRLRLQDLQSVNIDGITLLPEDNVDIWFRNINGTLSLNGGISCFNCNKDTNMPNLKIHMLDTINITMNNVVVEGVEAMFKVRSADQLLIQDSYFKSLPKDSIEVFNVPRVTISHSEFHNTTNSSILLNRVESFDISDSLLKRESLEILDSNGDNINVDRSPDPADNLTAISWRCTISPLMSASDVLSPEDQILCSTAGRRHPFFSRGSGFESGGAIVLAVVSSVILLAAVSVLAVMHRMGKLDQYL